MKKIVAVILAICAIMMTFMFTSCKKENDDTKDPAEAAVMPELKIEATSESGSWIVVETTYGEVRYPYAFSELISVNATSSKDSAHLQFVAEINGEDVVVYTIYYNEEIGSRLGEFDLGGEVGRVSVSVVFETASDLIPEEWLSTFYATQETFNDVLTSIGEDIRFTEAE